MKLGLFIVIGLTAGCNLNQDPRNSILVIAIDRLGRDAVLCGEATALQSGFQMICQDSVRFTHAFTTSPLAVPALSSLLTGQLPIENGVLHNGPVYLTAQMQTVAEAALEKGYRTAFFSGGAPVWSKSGLAQGYELFDDYLDLRPSRYYRDATTNLALVWNWIEKDVPKRNPFFATVYLADTQFDEVPTYDEYGALRESTYEGQIKEIDESLGVFFRRLKAAGYWDSTYIFVVGLSGGNRTATLTESKGSSLYSENVQVPLMIKPARKPRDEGIKWTVDANVSIVDVGQTLYQLLGDEAPRPKHRVAEVVSLKELLSGPQVHFNRSRLIPIMTGWASWHGFSGLRFGFRKDDLTFYLDNPPSVFNTLTDRAETTPLPLGDRAAAQLIEEGRSALPANYSTGWDGLEYTLVEKNKVGTRLWRKNRVLSELLIELRQLHQLRPQDRQVSGWLAEVTLKVRDWAFLLKLGRDLKVKEWVYVAQKNLNRRQRVTVEGCFSLLQKGLGGLKEVSPRKCDDSTFVELLRWYFEPRGLRKDILREKFIRSYRLVKMLEKVYSLNYTNGLQWDVSIERPGTPSNTSLALALPEMASYSKLVDQRLSGND